MSERILTLRVTVKDPEAAKVLWEAHGKNELLAGCRISAICDGDLIAERNNYELYLEYLEGDQLFEDGTIMEFSEWVAQT